MPFQPPKYSVILAAKRRRCQQTPAVGGSSVTSYVMSSLSTIKYR